MDDYYFAQDDGLQQLAHELELEQRRFIEEQGEDGNE